MNNLIDDGKSPEEMLDKWLQQSGSVRFVQSVLKKNNLAEITSNDIRNLNRLFSQYFKQYGNDFNVDHLVKLQDLKLRMSAIKSSKWYLHVNMKATMQQINRIVSRIIEVKENVHPLIRGEIREFLKPFPAPVLDLIIDYDAHYLADVAGMSNEVVPTMSLVKCASFGTRCAHYKEIGREDVFTFFQNANEKQLNAFCRAYYKEKLRVNGESIECELDALRDVRDMIDMLPKELMALDLSDCGSLWEQAFWIGMSRLSNLKSLCLSHCSSDFILKMMKDIPHFKTLEEFDLSNSGTTLTMSNLEFIQSSLPCLKKLDLTGCLSGFTQEMVKEIENGKFWPEIEIVTKH